MQNSRLVEVFLSLSKVELKALDKYLASPYFNQREDVCDLFKCLQAHLSAGKVGMMTKQKVFAQLFKGATYNEKRLSYVMSFLYKHIKNFLAIAAFQEKEGQLQLRTAREFKKRGLFRQFESEMNALEKSLARKKTRDSEYHYDLFQLEYEKSAYIISKSRQSPANLIKASDALIAYFLAKLFKMGSSLFLIQSVSKSNESFVILNRLLEMVEEGAYLGTPAVALYYYGYKALTVEEPRPYFDELRNLIRSNHEQFHPDELRDIYALAINHGIQQYNKGRKDYMEQVLDLYKEGLNLEVFIQDGVLSKFTYNNVVIAGLVQKEFEWVEEFLHAYKPYLDEADRESSFNYNLAILYYRKPDYSKALELLRSVEFKDVMHDLYARRMLLKIYFELGEYNALESLLISFRAFIYRHKELGYTKSNYLNLIRFTNKLLQLDRYDKTIVARLREEIEQTKAVAEKDWLLGQIREKTGS